MTSNKAYIFDIHGVLLKAHDLSKIGVNGPDSKPTYKEILALRDRLLTTHCFLCSDTVCKKTNSRFSHAVIGLSRGETSWHDIERHMRKIVEKYQYNEQIKKALLLFCQPAYLSRAFYVIEKTESFVARLVDKYGKDSLYILSNASQDTFDNYSQRFPMLFNLFKRDHVLLSAHVGVQKPDPKIFHLFLEKYALAGQQCVFFDDAQKNVAAAAQVGIRGILFNDDLAIEQYE